MAQNTFHVPVLADEIVAFLVRKPGIYVDGTLGGGGHSGAFLRALHQAGYIEGSLLIGIDQDDAALMQAADTLREFEPFTVLVKANFEEISSVIESVCSKRNLAPKVSGILLDLGVSSFQIDSAERGFSYLRNGPLDMRMDSTAPFSAAEIVNTSAERELATIFYRYGEEPRSRAISRAIVAYRQKHGPISDTEELAGIIRSIAYGGDNVIKTLSRVFQALRIAVNRELDVLREALCDGIESLEDHGRMAVISYHSLEDRIVKTVFADQAREDWGPKGVALREPLKRGSIKLITRKPLVASAGETASNSRARSAKLRVIEKNPAGGSSEH
ncbi:MAG: 16S rRNA (cytosine(1402)-N(4))-methyltransferase RsmH [Chlorobiaceae bacterium]|nr:16S rRNA (cytosine(1402)-N(4))-methyltransferase RsmH [Chlorobiaceae bacterium]